MTKRPYRVTAPKSTDPVYVQVSWLIRECKVRCIGCRTSWSLSKTNRHVDVDNMKCNAEPERRRLKQVTKRITPTVTRRVLSQLLKQWRDDAIRLEVFGGPAGTLNEAIEKLNAQLKLIK